MGGVITKGDICIQGGFDGGSVWMIRASPPPPVHMVKDVPAIHNSLQLVLIETVRVKRGSRENVIGQSSRDFVSGSDEQFKILLRPQ